MHARLTPQAGVRYSLRRGLGSLLVQSGTPIYTVSKILGHSSIATTANDYAHLDAEAGGRIWVGCRREIGRSAGWHEANKGCLICGCALYCLRDAKAVKYYGPGLQLRNNSLAVGK